MKGGNDSQFTALPHEKGQTRKLVSLNALQAILFSEPTR